MYHSLETRDCQFIHLHVCTTVNIPMNSINPTILSNQVTMLEWEHFGFSHKYDVYTV